MNQYEAGACVLEIAAHSLSSAIAASQGGADRIELCCALEVGGLTPSLGLLREVRKAVQLPIRVLIRPRIGNFCYDSSELRTIRSSIENYRSEGVSGFVFGCLTTNDDIDYQILEKIVAWAAPIPIAFHRAFDLVSDPIKAGATLAELGVQSVLTSGQQATAWEGRELLKGLNETDFDIEFVAGSGIHAGNIKDLAEFTGLKAFHSSAKTFREGLSAAQHDRISGLFGRYHDRDGKWESSMEEIQRIKEVLSNLSGSRS